MDVPVAVAAGLRSDPLLRRIVEVDPELLVPYLFDRRGVSQGVMLDRIESMLTEGRRGGTVRGLLRRHLLVRRRTRCRLHLLPKVRR
ncbi:hypothetical protein AB0C21_42280 [Spirillospora sp. NPDC049024]